MGYAERASALARRAQSTQRTAPRSIFVATPMYGGQCHGAYVNSLLNLLRACTAERIEVKFKFLFNESLIPRARNYLADEFMRSGCTHLLFVDSDIAFNAPDALTLLSLDKDIAGGPYPKKRITWINVQEAARAGLVEFGQHEDLAFFAGDFAFSALPGAEHIKVDLDQPAQVLDVGTGFLMVKRESLERFAAAFPQYWFRPNDPRLPAFDGTRKVFQFFTSEIDPVTEQYVSEDYWFCRKAREAGLEVWLCPWMEFRHFGAYAYQGSMKATAHAQQARATRCEGSTEVSARA